MSRQICSLARRATSSASVTARTPCAIRSAPEISIAPATEAGPWPGASAISPACGVDSSPVPSVATRNASAKGIRRITHFVAVQAHGHNARMAPCEITRADINHVRTAVNNFRGDLRTMHCAVQWPGAVNCRHVADTDTGGLTRRGCALQHEQPALFLSVEEPERITFAQRAVAARYQRRAPSTTRRARQHLPLPHGPRGHDRRECVCTRWRPNRDR
jgi:hypothetical protein